MKFEEISCAKYYPSDLFSSFIYFLVKDNHVIYIGQSINGVMRPFEHGKSMDYDYFFMLKCEPENLTIEEKKYILKYRPSNNKAGLYPTRKRAKHIPLEKLPCKSISVKVLEYRKQNGLSQKELAKSVGIHSDIIARIENESRPVKPVTKRKVEIYIDSQK